MTLQQLNYAVTVAKRKSLNKAAEELFVSQPNISKMIKDLEKEIGVEIFKRTNRGIVLTAEGEEFIEYATQVLDQYKLIEDKYVSKKTIKSKFNVSTQHYSFATTAFVALVKKLGMEEYEFGIKETKTREVIDDVSEGRSEIGVLFLNDFNTRVLSKIISDKGLIFTELFKCKTYAYLSKKHPLAGKSKISLSELEDYPFMYFDQGSTDSFFFAEEVFITYSHNKSIRLSDRATMLNLMVGLNGYTLCSGIICEDLYGYDYKAIPLVSDDVMRIGYLKRDNLALSSTAQYYIEELSSYKALALPTKD